MTRLTPSQQTPLSAGLNHCRYHAMLIAIALTILLVLGVLRRILEPSCPSCSAKHWTSEHPAQLTCGSCGWSSVPAAVPVAPVEAAPGQYEICFR